VVTSVFLVLDAGFVRIILKHSQVVKKKEFAQIMERYAIA
jgi:hypothetical protein